MAQSAPKLPLKRGIGYLGAIGAALVLGYAAYTFALGGLAFWMPSSATVR